MAAPHQALLPLIRCDELPPGVRITADVVASAEEHGVAALIDDQVTRREIDLGHDLRTRLAMTALAVVAENQAAQAAAESIVQTANDLNIDISIFKGVAIGRQFYEKPSLRPTIDVDVFVDPNQVHRMGDLFAALGSPNDKTTIDAMVEEGRVFEQTIDVGGTELDVHRDPMNMLLVSRLEHQRWGDTTWFHLSSGEPARTLDRDWTIVQSLLHAFRDNFADLLHIYDLDLMFDKNPDWDRIAAIAQIEGWTDIVRYATAFVCDVLDRTTPLPRRIQRSSLLIINRIWPNKRLLQGANSVVRSHRRQSALSLMTQKRTGALTAAYARRIVPPRSVIDMRAQPSDDPYAVALYRWRMSQRRAITDMKASVATNEATSEEI